jgi:hypothetical protein
VDAILAGKNKSEAQASIERVRAYQAGKYPLTWLNETDAMILEAIQKEPQFPIYPRGSSPLSPIVPVPSGKAIPIPTVPVNPSTKPFSFFL